MDKLLVDTNIVLDLLAGREEFYQEAQELFTLADQGKITLDVSALTFANIYYILSQKVKMDAVRSILRKFKVLVNVLSLHDKILELALESPFRDFEDAIQYYSGLESGAHIIITRNKKDFKSSTIPVLTAKEYLMLRLAKEK